MKKLSNGMKALKKKSENYNYWAEKIMSDIRTQPLRIRVSIAFRMIHGLGLKRWIQAQKGYVFRKKKIEVAGTLNHKGLN